MFILIECTIPNLNELVLKNGVSFRHITLMYSDIFPGMIVFQVAIKVKLMLYLCIICKSETIKFNFMYYNEINNINNGLVFTCSFLIFMHSNIFH